ncbi:MAG: flagellar hook-length control protein FliK [Gammaproteobacteria bacterium]|nr:flagellar hook-length control protein FliK [Gammaproteobacteria bacterium]
MANASVNNLHYSALSGAIKKGLGHSKASGMDGSFNQLFDQARQDIKPTNDPVPASSRSKPVRVTQDRPAAESSRSNNEAQASASTRDDKKQVTSNEAQASTDTQAASSTSSSNSDAGSTDATAQADTAESSVQAETDTVTAQSDTAAQAASVTENPPPATAATEDKKVAAVDLTETAQTTVAAEQTETVISSTETEVTEVGVALSEQAQQKLQEMNAAQSQGAAKANDVQKSAQQMAGTEADAESQQPAANASSTARSVHEMLQQQRQQAQQQAQRLAAEWASLSADQKEQFLADNADQPAQFDALLRNDLSRGNMEALQRMLMHKGGIEMTEANQKSASEDATDANDLILPQADPDSLAQTAQQHANSEKMRAVIQVASENMMEKRINTEAIFEQLNLQGNTAETAKGAVTTPVAAGSVSALGHLQRPAGLAGVTPPGVPGSHMTLDRRVDDPTWGNEFAKRISFLARGQLQQAEIRLNPPELGQIAVRINMVQDQTNITFTAQHGNVREAIEAALPRLRELLNDSGLQMGSVNVSTQQQFAQQQHGGFAGFNHGDSRLAGAILPGGEEESMTGRESTVVRSTDRLVDYFA